MATLNTIETDITFIITAMNNLSAEAVDYAVGSEHWDYCYSEWLDCLGKLVYLLEQVDYNSTNSLLTVKPFDDNRIKINWHTKEYTVI